jgi:hypothetical protein
VVHKTVYRGKCGADKEAGDFSHETKNLYTFLVSVNYTVKKE